MAKDLATRRHIWPATRKFTALFAFCLVRLVFTVAEVAAVCLHMVNIFDIAGLVSMEEDSKLPHGRLGRRKDAPNADAFRWLRNPKS